MNEEHTLALSRERSRVQGKMRLDADNSWQSRAITPFVALPANICSILHKVDIPASVAFETGYPSKDKLNTAVALISSLPVMERNTERAARESDFTDSVDKRISLAKHLTFIDGDNVLVSASGKMSKLTRSIGNKSGATACIPIPELTAVTIKQQESGRFVIASRGLWSAVSEEAIREAVQKYKSPKDLASYLGKAAESRFGRNDNLTTDVYVIVVDVNPYFKSRDVFGLDDPSSAKSGCSCSVS
jgi:hypothetical protein